MMLSNLDMMMNPMRQRIATTTILQVGLVLITDLGRDQSKKKQFYNTMIQNWRSIPKLLVIGLKNTITLLMHLSNKSMKLTKKESI